MGVIHRALTTQREKKAFGMPWGIKGLMILCGNPCFVSASSGDRNVTCKGCLREIQKETMAGVS